MIFSRGIQLLDLMTGTHVTFAYRKSCSLSTQVAHWLWL